MGFNSALIDWKCTAGNSIFQLMAMLSSVMVSLAAVQHM
jgi:hypothetical protein